MHWPDNSTPVEETMEAIEILLQQGKIRAAGVSNFSKDLLARAHKQVIQVSNQVPYSMVLRDIEEELVPYCIENHIGILAYSPLQRGLLTGKITPEYHFNEGDHRPNTPHFKPQNINKVNAFLEQIKPIADGYNATLAQLVLHWTVRQPGITSALAGARNARQIEENAGAMDFSLREDEINTINGLLDNLALEL
jgi:aryl-alcohol dehydrogenase-like predicted oxidoreductase